MPLIQDNTVLTPISTTILEKNIYAYIAALSNGSSPWYKNRQKLMFVKTISLKMGICFIYFVWPNYNWTDLHSVFAKLSSFFQEGL